MAVYELTLNSEQLSGLLTSDKGLQDLVETVGNQVLEAQVTAHIGAQPYERSAQRKTGLDHGVGHPHPHDQGASHWNGTHRRGVIWITC